MGVILKEEKWRGRFPEHPKDKNQKPEINEVCLYSPGVWLAMEVFQPLKEQECLCTIICIKGEHLAKVKFENKEKMDFVSYNSLVRLSLKNRKKKEQKSKSINQKECQPEEPKSEPKKKLTKKEIAIIDKRLRQSYPQTRSFDEEAEAEDKARRKLRKFQPVIRGIINKKVYYKVK